MSAILNIVERQLQSMLGAQNRFLERESILHPSYDAKMSNNEDSNDRHRGIKYYYCQINKLDNNFSKIYVPWQ